MRSLLAVMCRRPVGRQLALVAAVIAGLISASGAQAATTYLISSFASAATPEAVAVTPAGDVYLADAHTGQLLRFTPAGTATVVASGLNAPSGVTVDPAGGTVFVSDTGDHEVDRVNGDGTLTVIAGTGTAGTPTAGAASASKLGGPGGLAVDAAGDLFIADGAGASGTPYVEKVTPAGTISILAGNGTQAQPVPGAATSSPLRTPTGVAVDAAGDVLIADAAANVIEKVTPTGSLSIFAGRANGTAGAPSAGTATASRLNAPTGVGLDTGGTLYIADANNNRVETVSPAGRLSLFAGTGAAGSPTYGGSALLSALNHPAAVAVGADGLAYVADTAHATVDRIAPAPPVASTPPAPTGALTQGQTLTAAAGTWSNAPTSYAYQWQRCDGTGAGCSTIAGAGQSTYTLSGADAGHTVRVLVTAANVGGSTTAASLPTGVVIPQPPGAEAAPSIAGTVVDVQTLAASPGSWTNDPTRFAYQWQDCDASGQNCTAIAGATAGSYTLALSDVGDTVRVVVTALNAGGSAKATSAPTALIAPALTPWANTPVPAPLAAPVISGPATVGTPLSCSTGSWSGDPSSYEIQWDRSNAPIADATGATYTVTEQDRGHALSCTVIATNAGGAIQAESARLAIPAPIVCPVPSGALDGGALGPLQLGDTRSQARVLMPRYAGSARQDRFCLAGGQSLRAVYASPSLVRAAITRADRPKVSGRIVLILSGDHRYAVRGLHPGARVRGRAGRPLHIGRATWYVIPGAETDGVIEARGGTVLAVGVADRRLSATPAAARRLLSGVA